MYYERKFDFQVAARKRVSGDQTPSVCSPAAKHPPQGCFSVARADPTLLIAAMARLSRQTRHKPRVTDF
jgi:hypothetical protein